MLWLNDPRVAKGFVLLNFKGDSPPAYNPPQQTLPTASDLYNQAQTFYGSNPNYSGLLSAQSNALANVNNPNYYSNFQPTSFENALGQQQFQNVWPDESAAIKQQFSQSGLSSSPALAETLGRAQGGLETQIGEYLNNQANTRAQGAINAGMQISPSQLLNPYVQTGENQALNQANLNLGQYNAQYQNQLANYQYGQQQNQGIGQLIGAGVGAAGGAFVGMPFQGAAFGSQLGGLAAGGTANPQSLAFSGIGLGQGAANTFGGGGNFNVPGYGSTSTNGMTFGSMPQGGGYSNTANVFGNGAQGVY